MKLEKENKLFIHDRPILKNWKYLVKLLISYLLDAFYTIYLLLSRKESQPKKHYVSICAIFKNEACYLREWIEYHRIIGVEHFYLYNNFSDDNFREILAPYIKHGIVELFEWPHKAGQISAYEDCFEKKKAESRWLCFIDLDEFICPHENMCLADWLHAYERYPSVVVYWKMFGSSGKLVREKELVCEEFVVSWHKLVDIGKPFFNTDFSVDAFLFTHSINAQEHLGLKKISIPSVNEFKKFISYNINRAPLFKAKNNIQINHYYSKTFTEYMEKKIPRGEAFQNRKREVNEFFIHETNCISVDYKIYRFLIQLKKRMVEHVDHE